MAAKAEPKTDDLPAETPDEPTPPAASAAPVRKTPKAAAEAPAAGPPYDPALDKLRVSIARVIQYYFAPLFIVTLLCVAFLFFVITFGLFQESAINVMALAASVQVAFGMIIGFVCVYIGLMMTWFGIDAAYSLKGSFGAGEVKSEGALKSASPGLLFALGGMILIAVALYKPIVLTESGLQPSGSMKIPRPGQTTDDETITPDPPPPTTNTSE